MPDDSDKEEDQDEEFQLWQIREMNRIKLYLDSKESHTLELQEIEKRRSMTDEARQKELESQPLKEKRKLAFLQKSYKLGPYNQHLKEDPNWQVLQRDYSAPVPLDKVDKTNLPQIL